MTVAIDFTASNGKLHYLDPDLKKRNDYELAIQEVGKILQPYSYKQQFNAFGFGGIPHYLLDNPDINLKRVNVNHFPLTEDLAKNTIDSLDELRLLYRSAIENSTLWGPTLFKPFFDQLELYMIRHSKYRMYHCLLILTDGDIHDLRETVDKIVECAEYPLSIIIVGLGDADFTAMETLDSDEYELVDGKGTKAKRDIA